jgi:serine/threonine-protein phosphatase 2B regulatory subunit
MVYGVLQNVSFHLRRIIGVLSVQDNSGSIEILELFMYLDIDRTPFTKRSFSVFDSDGSGFIDFKEFVISLWNYCTLGKATLLIFAFDIYDVDKSGCIDSLEIER